MSGLMTTCCVGWARHTWLALLPLSLSVQAEKDRRILGKWILDYSRGHRCVNTGVLSSPLTNVNTGIILYMLHVYNWRGVFFFSFLFACASRIEDTCCCLLSGTPAKITLWRGRPQQRMVSCMQYFHSSGSGNSKGNSKGTVLEVSVVSVPVDVLCVLHLAWPLCHSFKKYY